MSDEATTATDLVDWHIAEAARCDQEATAIRRTLATGRPLRRVKERLADFEEQAKRHRAFANLADDWANATDEQRLELARVRAIKGAALSLANVSDLLLDESSAFRRMLR